MAISSTPCGLYAPSYRPLQQTLKPVERADHEKVAAVAKEQESKKSPRSATMAENIIRPPSVRSSFAVDPTRELKAIHIDPKQSLATQTFLDIAHYEENFHLVDIFA